MRYEFHLPALAEGMMEGEIVSWLVGAGDDVRADQPIVEVMTDKATVVVQSPYDGKVLELGAADGDIADVGSVLWVMEIQDGIAPAATAPTAAAKAPPTAAPAAPTQPAAAAAAPATAEVAAAPPAAAARATPPAPRGAGKALATPATRRLARELGVDIGSVRGTGPAGRVTADDLRKHGQAVGPVAAPAPSVERAAPAYAPARRAAASDAEVEERVKLRGLRRAIYESMARSKSTAAHFTYVDEVDCELLVAARNRLKPAAAERGVKLSYLPFIAKATLLALARFEKVNASMDDAAQEIVLKRYFHLGIAAATDSGLTVPVIKHADQLSLLDLAGHIQDLGQRARTNLLKPAELRGSTFTISSLGRLGGLFATPIINHPEVAILGIHEMQKRAVVRGDDIVARTMMNISLSFDHRVIDGHEGAAFCQAIKAYLEQPDLMMLEMA